MVIVDLADLELTTHNLSYALGQKWCGRLLSHSCMILSLPPFAPPAHDGMLSILNKFMLVQQELVAKVKKI
jgi:hypothetical protein